MTGDDALLRTLLVIVAAIVLLPVLMMVLVIPMMGIWGSGHMWNGGSGTGVWLAMWLVVLAIVGGVGYLLYRATRQSDDRRTDAALEELRMAYARGDLSDEEFENRRNRLQRER